MTEPPEPDVTRLLLAVERGEAGASDALLRTVHEELKRLARAHVRRTPAGETPQATALGNEAYLGLVGGRPLVEYVGSEGTLRLEGETHLTGARHGEPLAPIPVDAPPAAREPGTSGDGPFERMLPLYLRDVVAAVRGGATELPGAATSADGLATMRVLDAARRSARSDRWEPCGP